MFSNFRLRRAGCGIRALLVATIVGLGATGAPGVTPSGGLAAQDLTQSERQRMYQQVKPAVVLVQTQIVAQIHIDLGGQQLSGQEQIGGTGSGWIISPDGYLITNGHVVGLYHENNEDELKQQLLYQFIQNNYIAEVQQELGRQLTQEELIQIIPQLVQRAQVGLVKELQVVLQNGDRLPTEVKQFSPAMSRTSMRVSFPNMRFEPGKDVAVLKIEGRDLPTVAIGNSDQVSIGDDVYPAGYPSIVADHPFLSERTQMEPSFTRGSVSSVKLAVGGAEVMQMDAPISWGNSGGPVFNGRGEVVGMATFGSASQEAGGQQMIQGFNFAVPTSTVMEFVRAEGVAPSAGLFNRTWSAALDAYHAGRWGEAVEGMDEVLRVHAGLPDAVRLRSLAVAQRGSEPEAPWMIITFVAIGLGLIGMGLVVRRRGAMQPAYAGAAGSVQRVASPLAVVGANGRRALPGSSRLVVVEGPLRGNRFEITESGVKIGRDSGSCQVVLTESASSREHAMVFPTGRSGPVMIRNLSGTNPTFVNDRPVQEAALTPGDRIRIAGSVLTFESE